MAPKPKPGAKLGKDAKAAAGAAAMKASGGPQKPKKPPAPPACFTPEDIVRYKEVFKEHDEDNIEKIPLELIPLMLRKIGFNPKGEQIEILHQQILEDEYVDTVEFHEWLQMIELKLQMGDDFEIAVTKAMATLGHDDEENTGFCSMELLRDELFTWGETLQEVEFVDWLKLAIKDKTYNVEDGSFNYPKFVENMNAKDARLVAEPINFFKLDQKTLAALAMKKAQEEKEEQEKKEAERKAREEAKRQKMIADGLLPPD